MPYGNIIVLIPPYFMVTDLPIAQGYKFTNPAFEGKQVV
jgi:hypothetical protein